MNILKKYKQIYNIYENNISLNEQLIKGILYNDINIIKNTIKQGANVNEIVIRNYHKTTPLIIAINNSTFEIIKLLFSLGGNVNKIIDISQGNIALTDATLKHNFKLIKYLIEEQEAIDYNNIAFLTAITEQVFNIVTYFIKNGSDVNATYDNTTALHYAAMERNLKIVLYLIENNANWFIQDSYNKYFIDYLNNQQKDKLKNLYPKKYLKYLKLKKSNRFNI